MATAIYSISYNNLQSQMDSETDTINSFLENKTLLSVVHGDEDSFTFNYLSIPSTDSIVKAFAVREMQDDGLTTSEIEAVIDAFLLGKSVDWVISTPHSASGAIIYICHEVS